MLPNHFAAADLVVSGLDDRDAVRVEVAHHQLAAVGLERQTDRRASHIEQGQHMVVLQIDGRHLS